MKITDCVIGVRDVIVGVIICILIGIVSAILMQPLEVSAQSSPTVLLESGVNRADDSMEGRDLVLPDAASTLELGGKDLTVSSLTASGAPLTIKGKGSLTVTGPVRMAGTSMIIDTDPAAVITLESGFFASGGTLDLREGTLTASGSYVYAATIRISGGTLTVRTTKDAIRADESFFLEGGTVSATGGTHGLHAEGAVTVKGGTIVLSGASGALYIKDPEQLDVARGIPASGGRNEEGAQALDTQTDHLSGYTYLALGDAQTASRAGTGASTQAQAGTSASRTQTATGASTQAQAGTSASRTGASAQAGTSASRTQTATGASSQAQAGTSASRTQAQAGTSTSRTGASAQAGTSASRTQTATGASTQAQAGTSASRTQTATGASTQASAQAGTSASSDSLFAASELTSAPTGERTQSTGAATAQTSDAATAQTSDDDAAQTSDDAAAQTSDAATAQSSSAATAQTTGTANASHAVTQVNDPVMGSNDQLTLGITLLLIAVISLLLLSGKALCNETNQKRRP